jgi:hypothetical protein
MYKFADKKQIGSCINRWLDDVNIGRAIGACGVLCVAAIIGGWQVGLSERTPAQTVTTPSNIKFTIPWGFEQAPRLPVTILSALGMGEALAYVPPVGASGGIAIIGESDGEGPTLMSREARAHMHLNTPPQLDELGQQYAAVRVSGTLTTETGTSRAIVYSVPMSIDTVNVVCIQAVRADAQTASATQACERLSTTLHIPEPKHGHAIELARLTSYQRALDAIVERYDHEHATLRLELFEARTADGEKQTAARLASECIVTAKALANLPPDPIAKPARLALQARLKDEANAYRALASAAARDNRRTYNEARKQAQAKDDAVQAHMQTIWTSVS